MPRASTMSAQGAWISSRRGAGSTIPNARFARCASDWPPAQGVFVTRILVDCRMAEWTGVGRYTVGLVRALAMRDDLDVVAAVAPGASAFADGLDTVTAAGNPFSPAGMTALGRAVGRVAPDVTHCPHFPTPLPVRHPLVVTMHDLTPLLVAGVMPSRVRRTVYRGQVARAVRIADALLTLSHF
ncbi:MAG: glycosyltransferase family 4 protein, partial [Actinobacteria bacterium]